MNPFFSMTHFPPVILHESTRQLVLLCLGTKPDTCKLGSLSRSQFLKTLRCKSLCVKKHGQGVSTLTGTSSTPLVRFLGWLTSSPPHHCLFCKCCIDKASQDLGRQDFLGRQGRRAEIKAHKTHEMSHNANSHSLCICPG